MRLQKYLAAAGVASRRAAEELIRSGHVEIDGATVTDPARDVADGQRVLVDGAAVSPSEERLVFAVNKPLGVVSTARDPQGRPTVVALVPVRERLYPVGRLDVDTTGLILLTNDGELAHGLTHPKFEVPKTYRAVLARAPVRERALRALRAGVRLEDGMTSPAQIRRLAPDTLELTIHEGRKRQVRRMCEAVGHPVLSLRRVAIGPVELGDLREGKSRQLSVSEMSALRRASAGS